jgi:hypothetical protein
VCFRELRDELRRSGVNATESQIRWAIKTGKVARPRVDGSLRFDFTRDNAAELATYFAEREVASHV